MNCTRICGLFEAVMSQTETYTFAFGILVGSDGSSCLLPILLAEGEQNLPGVYSFGVLADATDITDTLSLKVPWR